MWPGIFEGTSLTPSWNGLFLCPALVRIRAVTLRSRWSHVAIWVHLLVVVVASWRLAVGHAPPHYYAFWAILSGVSLFVLTGLVHEASHRLLYRTSWLNELLGNLAGWI